MAHVYRQRLGNRNAHDTKDSVGSFWVEIFRAIELLFFFLFPLLRKILPPPSIMGRDTIGNLDRPCCPKQNMLVAKQSQSVAEYIRPPRSIHYCVV